MGDLLEVNGTRLYVDDRGARDAQPLLYIHGGPGQSCWDFMAAVGDSLVARGLRVIGVDQRGVLRSDPLPAQPALTVRVLVDDFERLRDMLKVDRWIILGHSAGGGYALDYCRWRPDSIQAAIFDCPSWDGDATDRRRFPVAAALLDDAGEHDAAAALRAAAQSAERLHFSTDRFEAMQKLGSDYMRLFTHDARGLAALEALADTAPHSLDWTKGDSHLPLAEDMYVDRTPHLAALETPSLLIHGQSDLVTPPQIISRYLSEVPGPHRVVTVDRARHFAFVEQPGAYVEAVTSFIKNGR